MQLTILSTDTITKLDGVPCRLWRAQLPGGGMIDVYVHRLGSHDPAAQKELETALMEMAAPQQINPPPDVPLSSCRVGHSTSLRSVPLAIDLRIIL